MYALLIYVVIAGSSMPWPHRIVLHDDAFTCRNAIAGEVAKAKKAGYTVLQAGCVKLAAPK